MNTKFSDALICRGCMQIGGLLQSMYDNELREKELPDKLADLAAIEVFFFDLLIFNYFNNYVFKFYFIL